MNPPPPPFLATSTSRTPFVFKSCCCLRWMALWDGNFLQPDSRVAGSWPRGRACVSPPAEDKYATALRRCSAGGWFPSRHLSQVIALFATTRSIFSWHRDEGWGWRGLNVRPAPHSGKTKAWRSCVSWRVESESFGWARKFQVQKQVRYTHVKLYCPSREGSVTMRSGSMCLRPGRLGFKVCHRTDYVAPWPGRLFLLRHDQIRSTCLNTDVRRMAAELNFAAWAGVRDGENT